MPREIPTDPDSLLTEDEAAELLQLSPRTLQTWRSKGIGPPCVDVGLRVVRYRRGALNAYVEQNTRAMRAREAPHQRHARR